MEKNDLRYHLSKKVTLVGMFVNTILAAIKMIVGLIGHSPALFADGVHSLSDLLSDVMVLLAAKHANKGADIDHPYGHERIETVATIILAILLIIVGGSIAYHALSNWYSDELMFPSHVTIYIAIISILANEWLFRYTMAAANKVNSDLLAANAWHSRSDMYSSAIVLIGLIGANFGLLWVDALAAVIVAYIIVKMGIKWCYKSFAELVDTGVNAETLTEIRTLLKTIDGVKKFHCLRTRKMAGQIMLDVHILVNEAITASEGHFVGECVRSTLAYNIPDIKDITVHIDVTEHPEHFTDPNHLPLSRKVIEAQLFAFIKKIGYEVNKNEIELCIYYYPKQIRLYLLIKKIPAMGLSTRQLANFSLLGVKKTDVQVFYIS